MYLFYKYIIPKVAVEIYVPFHVYTPPNSRFFLFPAYSKFPFLYPPPYLSLEYHIITSYLSLGICTFSLFPTRSAFFKPLQLLFSLYLLSLYVIHLLLCYVHGRREWRGWTLGSCTLYILYTGVPSTNQLKALFFRITGVIFFTPSVQLL